MIKVNSFSSSLEAAHALTRAILYQINISGTKNFHLAISGGTTPVGLFRLWAEDYKNTIPWSRIHLYWVDERCVPPESPDSNYGMTKRVLLDKVTIPIMQIHPIHGEDTPEIEAKRYSFLVENLLIKENLCPVFDCILLGIGTDGHTSSLFTGQNNLLNSPEIYAVSIHPQTRQKRIALTGLPILHAKKVFFYAFGKNKSDILKEVIKGNDNYPAGYIVSRITDSELFTDIL